MRSRRAGESRKEKSAQELAMVQGILERRTLFCKCSCTGPADYDPMGDCKFACMKVFQQIRFIGTI